MKYNFKRTATGFELHLDVVVLFLQNAQTYGIISFEIRSRPDAKPYLMADTTRLMSNYISNACMRCVCKWSQLILLLKLRLILDQNSSKQLLWILAFANPSNKLIRSKIKIHRGNCSRNSPRKNIFVVFLQWDILYWKDTYLYYYSPWIFISVNLVPDQWVLYA